MGGGSFLMRFPGLAVLSFCVFVAACPAWAEEDAAGLFQRAVASSGVDYVAARRALLEQAKTTGPFVERVAANSRDWRDQVTAQALLGWMEYPKLYQELWEWQAPDNRNRNPYPLMAAHARMKFSGAGEKAIPLMLELVWKRGDVQYGALPQLLSERKTELAVPVLVQWMAGQRGASTGWDVPEAVGRFGRTATPYLLEALKTAPPLSQTGPVKALGLTGDEKAVLPLRDVLKQHPAREVREMAAMALADLNQFAVLRQEYPHVQDVLVREEMLKVLGRDDSPETRKLLREVAARGSSGDERMRAVQALIQKPSQEDLEYLAAVAPKEPDDSTRSNFYLYLGSPYHKNPVVREALLRALGDRADLVRVRAIEGLAHYPEREVTRAMLPMLKAEGQPKRSAIFMLKERQDPIIAEAVLPLLADKEWWIQEHAADALTKNSLAKAAPVLIELLRSQHRSVRMSAARALARIGGPRVLEALKQAERDEKDESVKSELQSAVTLLSRHGAGQP
jgi:HEAT repeat protein